VIARTLRNHPKSAALTDMLTRIDHIGIACFDLDKTVEFYRATYGFEVFHSEVNEEQGVREAMLKINETSDGGASYLQLLEPTREDSAVGKWLAKNGEGVHHIAFGTADVDGDAADIKDKGVRVLYEEPRRGSMGSRITFLHPKDCHGVLTELVTSAPVESPEH
jgi:methylmalonyl-CoA/ethylmalonyl-CoA epimerase